MNLNREEDMEKVKILVPALTNFFELRGTGEKQEQMFGLMCTAFQFI